MCIDCNLEKSSLFFCLLILFEKLLDRPDFTQRLDFSTLTLQLSQRNRAIDKRLTQDVLIHKG